MKKNILGLAIIAMSMVSFSAMAQPRQKAQGHKSEQCSNEGCKENAHHAQRGAMPNPFAGINLSDSQKSQLKDLMTKRHEARKEKMATRKAEKNHSDSARAEGFREMRKQHLQDIKSILTPEQYVTFLENSVINAQQGHPGMRKDSARGDRHDKKFRKGNKHGKYSKGECPAQATDCNK